MTYLNKQFRDRICGKIAKSRIDFDSFEELKTLISDFKPDLIGIRTLSFYKDFFLIQIIFHDDKPLIFNSICQYGKIADGSQ